MDLKKMFSVINARAKSLIESEDTTLNDDLFILWYKAAESALDKLLGDEWRELLMWEGYVRQDSWEKDKARIKRALDSLESADIFTVNNEITIEEQRLIKEISATENLNQSGEKKIFIVHGHDNISKLELKNYLQNTLKLPEPVILHEQPNHGKGILEKFEEFATQATYAFILLTPDDQVAEKDTDNKTLYRARQNVIFEMGFFLGLFGRQSGRVILLYKGKLDIPSDVNGLVYIDITNGIESAGEKIRKELFN